MAPGALGCTPKESCAWCSTGVVDWPGNWVWFREVPNDEADAGGVTASFTDAAAALTPYFDELGIEVPAEPATYLPSFDEQFEAVLEARPAVVSFVFGMPPTEAVDRAHSASIRIVGAATNVAEAIAIEWGEADAVVATGPEAGGHRVSFLKHPEQSLVGGLALMPQVADAVNIPVIAAGGIADRRGVAAAFALGASGVQVGTAFLRTRESAISDAYRALIAAASADDLVLTRAMSGRLARGISNRAVREIEASAAIAAFPMQNWLTGRFRPEAGNRGITELQSLWMGQGAPLATRDTASEAFAELAKGLPA